MISSRTMLHLYRPSLAARTIGARLPTSRRHFVLSASRLASNGARGKKVAAAAYSTDAKTAEATSKASSFTVPTQSRADSADAGDVVPLSRQVYESMPSTMKNLSVMGKVVLITG